MKRQQKHLSNSSKGCYPNNARAKGLPGTLKEELNKRTKTP